MQPSLRLPTDQAEPLKSVQTTWERSIFTSLQAAKDAGAPVIGYGMFINTCLHFLIVAFAVFLLVRWINRLKQFAIEEEEAKPKTPPRQEVLLEEIRDLLKSSNPRS